MNKREVGTGKEETAAGYLTEHGYLVLEHNYYTPKGEIDIIAKEGGYLVFIEVKYRKNTRFGYPEEAVDVRKQNRIRNASNYYMIKHRISQYTACRYDVVVILGDDIKLLRNAFE